MKTMALVVALVLTPAVWANEVDRNFIDGMIMHHRDGIRMSEMAERKAQSDELRRLAAKMTAEQRKDIEEFQKMRAEGENPQRPELADMPGMMGMNMQWLEAKSGQEFDRAFSIAMTDHHLGGIKMSDHELSRGALASPKRMARKIRAAQRRDIAQMTKFRK